MQAWYLTVVVLAQLGGPAGAPGAAPASQTASPSPRSNTLHWTTSGEDEIYGFDVYRADTESGPFQRITPEPVRATGTGSGSRRYSYVDTSIEAGKTYVYYVETVDKSRVLRARLTANMKSKPKP